MPDQDAQPDSARYFNVEHVRAANLDALLAATELEGHRLIHLQVDRRAGLRAGTIAYVYTPFFQRGDGPARTTTTRAKKKAHA